MKLHRHVKFEKGLGDTFIISEIVKEIPLSFSYT